MVKTIEEIKELIDVEQCKLIEKNAIRRTITEIELALNKDGLEGIINYCKNKLKEL